MRSRWCPLHQFWNFMCQFDPGGLAEFPLRWGVRLGSCIQAIGYSHNPRYFSHFILFCVYRMLLRSCQHPFLALASLPEASSNDNPWIYIWQRNWGAGWACIFHFALHLLSLVPQRMPLCSSSVASPCVELEWRCCSFTTKVHAVWSLTTLPMRTWCMGERGQLPTQCPKSESLADIRCTYLIVLNRAFGFGFITVWHLE